MWHYRIHLFGFAGIILQCMSMVWSASTSQPAFEIFIEEDVYLDQEQREVIRQNIDQFRNWAEEWIATHSGEDNTRELKRLLNLIARVDPEGVDQQSDAMTTAFLFSEDAAYFEERGLAVAVRRFPEKIIDLMARGIIRDDNKLAITAVYLAKSDIKAAIPILEQIAQERKNRDSGRMAELAIHKLRGDAPKELFLKDTPEAMVRSYVEYVSKHPDWYTKEEFEFWSIPLMADLKNRWNEFLLQQRDTEKGHREAQERIELVRNLQTALEDPDKSFKVEGDTCVITFGERKSITIHRDMFGQWRFNAF